jgi:hypothetical protein
MRRALIVVVVSVVAWGCGPKKPSASALEAARLAREAAELKVLAESRTLQGCYDCLLEAKAAYAKLAVGADRPQMLVRQFETELLIALREKELALNTDAASSIARARALVPELAPALQAERYIKVVEAVPPDATGLPLGADVAFRRSKVQYVAGLDAEIVWLMGSAQQSETRRSRTSSRARCGNTSRFRSTARTSGEAVRRRSCDRRPGRDSSGGAAGRARTDSEGCARARPVSRGDLRHAAPRTA